MRSILLGVIIVRVVFSGNIIFTRSFALSELLFLAWTVFPNKQKKIKIKITVWLIQWISFSGFISGKYWPIAAYVDFQQSFFEIITLFLDEKKQIKIFILIFKMKRKSNHI